MKLLQFSIAVFVVGSNLKWHWTPNGYVAGAAALVAVLAVTALLSGLLRLLGRQQTPLKHFND